MSKSRSLRIKKSTRHICLHSSHSASGKRLKYNYFYLHVHELGKMSVILLFYFLRIHHYVFCHHFCYNTTSKYKCRCTSAVHRVSGAVSLVFVSDGFAYSNFVQRGEIHILHFSGKLLLHRFCISIACSRF